MNEKKEFLKNVAGMALSAGLAITTQGTSNLVLGVLGGIATGFTGSYFEKMEFNKIKSLLKDNDPSDLNHDLQKIIVQAIEWAILNIQILYKKEDLTKAHLKEVESFSKSLIEQIKLLKDSLSEKSGNLYTIIEKPKSDHELFTTFDLNVDSFPIIKPEAPYNLFFKENFTSNLQLCFGELLKNKANRPALIAYQREVYQNLDNNIDKVINQNELILKKLSGDKERETVLDNNKKWKNIKQKVTTTSLTSVKPEFEKLLNHQLSGIKQDTELLIDITSDIKNELKKVKGITKGISKELKQNWVSKNKVWIFSLFAVAIISILGLMYQIKTTPFTMSVGVVLDESIKVHTEYPALSKEAKIKFYFPSKAIEKDITSNNEVLLTEISSKLNHSKCKIELLDEYWEFSEDSILISENNKLLYVRPNDKLSNIDGKVLSRDGQTQINNAKIVVGNITATTNELGQFYIKVPISLRRINYVIRVEKEGYISKEKSYVSGDAVEILISKK
jgi:hypothetical protein